MAEELRKLIGYFENNEHRTDYPSYRSHGWDIGSGPTEAGCKVVGARLKGSGMRWLEEGAAQVAPLRALYLEYLMRALPPVARTVASNPDAYVYLAESIRAWPDQAGLARRLSATGWTKVAWRNLTGGIVALHRAVRPGTGHPYL